MSISENVPYSADMAGRPATKPAPPFGERLAALRKERGWTQPQLAERLGATVTMVTYLERRAKNPTVKTMEQIARIFGVPVSELLGLAKVQPSARKPGPPSRLQELTGQLSKLPRGQQKIVIRMLEGFLKTSKSS
jgi:transcriptional regulator with XRE-family HTH domain